MWNILLEEASCHYASSITPQLYLSDLSTAENDAKLKELGITHVVSVVAGSAPNLPQFISVDRRLHIDVEDDRYARILQHLGETTAFITAAIEEDANNKVLVCHSA